MEAGLHFRKVSKRIGSKQLVDEVSFSVYPGEVFGLLGPNGAGKTTLIRLAVGLIAMTKGEIVIDGYSLKKSFSHAIEQVGAIIETPVFYDFLTGYQNLVHYANLSGRVSKDRIDEIVDRLNMESFIHAKTRTYSLGMKQRLGIAQALLHQPTVLILDEPTNGLDPVGIRELRKTLRYLAEREKVAVLVSSHLLAEMEMMCDRVGIISKGRMVSVRNLEGDDIKNRLFEVNLPQQAFDVIHEKFPEVDLEVTKRVLKIQADAQMTALINESLVKAGIAVYGIAAENRRLEDLFMEDTDDALSGPINME
ncbi:MAG TPA: ABC transporter ATP-binding protein [Bacillota bacterium]|nr:ABC transporter ATP-binding protein [Bacillota bacterium]